MMILNAHFRNRWHSADGVEEVRRLVWDLVPVPGHERPSGFVYAGTDALLCFAGERFHHDVRTTPGVNGCLVTAINAADSYGAFMWSWGDDDPIWVSDNPRPPDFDPGVVSDPGGVLFHDPRSTLPISQFREVLEEFCYSGTGKRPAGIRWTLGDPCGRRMDRGYYDRVEIVSDRFADTGQRRGMTGHVIMMRPGRGLWVEVVNPDGITGATITAQPEDLRLLTRGTGVPL